LLLTASIFETPKDSIQHKWHMASRCVALIYYIFRSFALIQVKRVSSALLVVLIAYILSVSTMTFFKSLTQTAYAQASISDNALNVEAAVEGLSSPTSMIFLGDNNILVLEKEGSVRLVSNGVLQEEPILQVPVNAENERGLLGIAADEDNNSVFLYYTEADPLRNRVYKYQWNGQSLVNPTLILDLPAEPGPNHDGGKIVIGPDSHLYAVIGDLNHDGQLQNFPDGPPPDDTGVIFRVNSEDGSAAPDNPFVNSEDELLSKYYAYGVRNSFGIAFDPLTGNLWDTENGPASYDEVNLVRPGFNSGWQTVMGPISLSGDTEEDLVNFPGSHYADPLFSWAERLGPTDIEFFNSTQLGERYTNNIFVGDITRGNLYFFEVNENRDGISSGTAQQQSGLSDLVVDNEDELSAIIFGSGFGGITDIETGPDGNLYVLSFDDGIIYEISSGTTTQ
jgi:aldose sugar dehydrogenase